MNFRNSGTPWLLAGLLLLLLLVMLGSVCVGAVSVSPGRTLRTLLAPERAESMDRTIIWQLRLPRVLLAVVVGMGLATAGAAYQGLMRNPLADPFVVGASSGAALGATLAIVLGWRGIFLGISPVAASAFLGALLAAGLVYALAAARGAEPTALLLAGAALSNLIGGIVSLMMFLSERDLATILGWLLGSLSGRDWANLMAAAPQVLVGALALWLLARPLDALTFGEETAQSLGLRLDRLRLAVIAAASLTTAAAVSASGIIGFVGLIAPHTARLLVGGRHAVLIPCSALLGALLLLLADNTARIIAAPVELPVGVMTAILGGPFFLYLLAARTPRS